MRLCVLALLLAACGDELPPDDPHCESRCDGTMRITCVAGVARHHDCAVDDMVCRPEGHTFICVPEGPPTDEVADP